jgi:CRP-like cAMP-binding protein
MVLQLQPHSKASAALCDEDLKLFFECGRRFGFNKGEDVLKQGQLSDSLFVVVEGFLEVRRQGEGHEIVVASLEPGSFFGEMSLFDPGLMTVTVRALSDGTGVAITRDHLESFVSVRPEAGARLLIGMLEYLASRCRQLYGQLTERELFGALSGTH